MQQVTPTLGLLYEKINHFGEDDRRRIKTAAEKLKPDCNAIGSALILLELGLDADCVIAAFLASPGLAADIRNEYGEVIALLAGGARKVETIPLQGKTNAEAENIRKMLFAMAGDIRVLFIILAARLQALRSYRKSDGGDNDTAIKKLARECLDIYAPLADRFGVSWLKDEMEDLSLKYVNYAVFLQIKDIVAQKRNRRQSFLDAVRQTLQNEARKAGIDGTVETRAKHFYSIYQKMRKRNKRADEIYDLFGVRILCNTVEDCYTLLGMVHRIWKPLERRFKDYIAMPKSNGYQSLHTTVVTDIDNEQQNYIEVQIRTFDMHRMAEYGIANHWLYKKSGSKEIVSRSFLPVVEKLKNFLEETPGKFLEDMKREILQDSIFVFTPQGKVIELPAGSTAIDFAYSIHTDIGNHCSLAKANGKVISLGAPLENTQVIEIVTSGAAHPHSSWINTVKTAKARNRIRAFLAQQEKQEKPAKPDTETTEKSPQKAHSRPENPASVLSAALPLKQASGVLVQDQKNILVHFAKCCNPVSGYDITGFVSRGRGIIIHRTGCNSLKYIKDFENRQIKVKWDYGND